jgi:hypothetical protein
MGGSGSQLALEFGGSAGASGSEPPRKVRRDTTVRLVEYAPFPRVRRDQRWRHGFTVDLSSRGLCLRAKEAAPMGSLLHVIVRSVDGRPFLDVIARVAWATRGPEGDVRVGLEFVASRRRAPLRVMPGGAADEAPPPVAPARLARAAAS